MTRPEASRRVLRWGRRVLAGSALVAAALVPSLPPRGPILLEVLTPASGDHVGIGGIDLLVKFPPEVAFGETFRALLNGADVTDQLTTGENGSSGRLVDLLPGENRLRLEIFGRVPWAPDEVFEQSRELRIWMRPPIELDRG
jgi:hypothetical protein